MPPLRSTTSTPRQGRDRWRRGSPAGLCRQGSRTLRPHPLDRRAARAPRPRRRARWNRNAGFFSNRIWTQPSNSSGMGTFDVNGGGGECMCITRVDDTFTPLNGVFPVTSQWVRHPREYRSVHGPWSRHDAVICSGAMNRGVPMIESDPMSSAPSPAQAIPKSESLSPALVSRRVPMSTLAGFRSR